jgi:hypothetical protein
MKGRRKFLRRPHWWEYIHNEPNVSKHVVTLHQWTVSHQRADRRRNTIADQLQVYQEWQQAGVEPNPWPILPERPAVHPANVLVDGFCCQRVSDWSMSSHSTRDGSLWIQGDCSIRSRASQKGCNKFHRGGRNTDRFRSILPKV